MCIFLSKLLGCCRSLCTPSFCCLVFALLIYTLPVSAQIVAIEDPIGRAAPSDPPNNPDPTDDQNGTELSTLDKQAITLAITPQKLSIELSPDQLIKQVALFDISGKLVFANTPKSPSYDTQFERELVGVHVLIIQTTQGIMHQKLLLQH